MFYCQYFNYNFKRMKGENWNAWKFTDNFDCFFGFLVLVLAELALMAAKLLALTECHSWIAEVLCCSHSTVIAVCRRHIQSAFIPSPWKLYPHRWGTFGLVKNQSSLKKNKINLLLFVFWWTNKSAPKLNIFHLVWKNNEIKTFFKLFLFTANKSCAAGNWHVHISWKKNIW